MAASGQGLGIDDVALSETVMGNVHHALVIGALGENGGLSGNSVRGKLLTALPAPIGTLGSSYSAALFTAKLAEVLCRKKDFDLQVLSANKQNSLQKYPSFEELLGD
ncbi:MAG: hypothetical protein U5R46_08650 [Gammaproteobacteria bacterium]|nr:hypothetical protein [Gammaproteobacteria bacterium]